jgi:hypothetical protein
MGAMRHLRKLVSSSFRVVQLDGCPHTDVAEPWVATTPTSCDWAEASTPKFADRSSDRPAQPGRIEPRRVVIGVVIPIEHSPMR